VNLNLAVDPVAPYAPVGSTPQAAISHHWLRRTTRRRGHRRTNGRLPPSGSAVAG